MTRQPNSKYWKERSIERLAAVERGTPKYLNEIQHMYESAAREIRENIAGIIGNYAKNADLTATEAFEILRTPVTAEEIEKLKVIAGSIPDKIERAKALARLNAPAYAARISRQQAVLESTRLELARLAPGQVQTMTNALTEAAYDSFNRTVFDIQQGFGLGYTFNQVSSGQIEEVLKQKWSGRHYSNRVWDNTEVLADRVKSVIKQNMITGRSWRRSLDEVTDIVKSGGLYSAKRLLQTETAYVANEMEAEAYEDADIDEYEFIATLDGRTSQVCQEKDGKIYKLKDRKPGVNYPPLHAHCRSTTGAVVEGFDTSQLQRRARDPKTGKNVLVPADMKYKAWEKSLSKSPGIEGFNLQVFAKPSFTNVGNLKSYHLGDYTKSINTKKLIITNERISHITKRHPEIGRTEDIIKIIDSIKNNPDYVLRDASQNNTVLYIGNNKSNMYELTVRLSIGKNETANSNSILTMYKLNSRTLKQELKNEILYKKQ